MEERAKSCLQAESRNTSLCLASVSGAGATSVNMVGQYRYYYFMPVICTNIVVYLLAADLSKDAARRFHQKVHNSNGKRAVSNAVFSSTPRSSKPMTSFPARLSIYRYRGFPSPSCFFASPSVHPLDPCASKPQYTSSSAHSTCADKRPHRHRSTRLRTTTTPSGAHPNGRAQSRTRGVASATSGDMAGHHETCPTGRPLAFCTTRQSSNAGIRRRTDPDTTRSSIERRHGPVAPGLCAPVRCHVIVSAFPRAE